MLRNVKDKNENINEIKGKYLIYIKDFWILFSYALFTKRKGG